MQEVLYAAACEPYFMAREIEIVDFNFETGKIRAKLKGENFESRKHGGEGKSQRTKSYIKILTIFLTIFSNLSFIWSN